jgi:hypothetical protein
MVRGNRKTVAPYFFVTGFMPLSSFHRTTTHFELFCFTLCHAHYANLCGQFINGSLMPAIAQGILT